MVKNHDPMTNRTRGLIPLPSGDVPTGTQCVMLCIPEGEQYMRQLMGGLYEFTHWNAYERDETHKATDVAKAWRAAILEGMLRCYQFKIKNGVLNYSSDGGDVWTPVPSEFGGTGEGHDPRNDEPLLPARTGSNIPCLAAANAMACYRELHKELSDWYGAIGFILDLYYSIGASLMRFFPQSWSIFGLSVDQAQIAIDVLAHSASLTEAAFTTTIQNDLVCILNHYADANGQWNQAAFDSIIADIALKSGDMWALLGVYLSEVSGIQGLNNDETTTSIDTWDCEICDYGWCWQWDFNTSQNGWRPSAADGSGWGATWAAPNGFASTGTKKFAIAYDWPASAHILGVRLYGSTGTTTYDTWRQTEAGGTQYGQATHPYIPSEVSCDLNVPACILIIQDNKPVALSGIRIYGDGTRPDFVDGNSCGG